MDKIKRYQKLVEEILRKYADLANISPNGVETQIVFDEDRQRYMLFRTGWMDKKRIHSAMIYVRLHNNKIWIEEDWTEDGIATELLEAGIPKEDIVLGFQHPVMRPMTEFAVA